VRGTGRGVHANPLAGRHAGGLLGGEPSSAPSGNAAATGPTCGTDPVELNAYFETGFDLPFKLSDGSPSSIRT
jgi:hypothetical protein